MVYKNNIPAPNDDLDISQPDLLANFSQLDTSMGVNHYDFSDLSGDTGKHKFLQMPEESSAPATAANEGALYTKESGSITSLFWRQENNGVEIKLTGVDPSLATPGYTTLPGGVIIQWGKTNIGGGAGTLNYPIAFTTTVYSTVITPVRNSSNVDTVYITANTSLTTLSFRNTSGGGITAINWIAIGV